MIKLQDLLKLLSNQQLIALSDKDGSQIPYAIRNKVPELNDIPDVYKTAEVLSIRTVADVLYVRINI